MIQITLTELQALLRTQRENCATSAYHNPGSLNYILNAPTPDLSHLKEVEDVTSEGNTNQASVVSHSCDVVSILSEIRPFMLMNGFIEQPADNSFINDHCAVEVQETGYAVCNNNGDCMYSDNHSIYWLIGNLTYYGYITKNYKQQ
jgi:hypothetical protein